MKSNSKLVMNNYRPNDYRTPRCMSEAFGPYAELSVEEETVNKTAWAILAAKIAAIAIVVVLTRGILQ